MNEVGMGVSDEEGSEVGSLVCAGGRWGVWRVGQTRRLCVGCVGG